ncbi:MAG: M20/M25/M40 family metallo-hydrolase [Elusimicrobia bacterium]|nr:M20/M25/M40 family metallo-hydrolase [Elusimicrobiota bacterium]
MISLRGGRSAPRGLSRALPADFWVEAARWIAFNTVTTRSNLPFLRRLQSLFAGQGFRARFDLRREGGVYFGNLLLFRGPPRGRPLLLNTHTDTVPPGPADLWTRSGRDPFRLARRSGVLTGLGVADVKLNLLCQWEALRRLGPVPFSRPVVLAATYGEERGLHGARRLVRAWRGPKPVLALVGEPSQGRPIHRHRGYLVFEGRIPKKRMAAGGKARSRWFRGRAAHSSTPRLGRNALALALDVLGRWTKAGKAPRVLSWTGGTAANQVPAESAMRWVWGEGGISRRVVHWEFIAGALDRFKKGLPRGCSFNFGVLREDAAASILTFDVRFPAGVSSRRIQRVVRRLWAGSPAPRLLIDDPALSARPGSPPLRRVDRALFDAGIPRRWTEKKTCTEAGLYSAWGVPAVVWGPGRSTGNVHRPNESISERDLAKAVDFYEALLRRWIQKSEAKTK